MQRLLQDATDEILALGHSEGFGAVFSGGNEGIIRYLASVLQQKLIPYPWDGQVDGSAVRSKVS